MKRSKRFLGVSVLALCFGIPAQAQQDVIPLTVELLNRSINKLPFVIAADRDLYRKYGLDVKLWMPDADDALWLTIIRCIDLGRSTLA